MAPMTTMTTVTNDPTNDHPVNHYGQMAWDHWRQHRPEDLATIEDPTRFFSELGEQVAETVLDRTEQLLASQEKVTGFVARFAQERTARQTAEDETLRTMVFTEPTSSTTDDQADGSTLA